MHKKSGNKYNCIVSNEKVIIECDDDIFYVPFDMLDMSTIEKTKYYYRVNFK